MDHIPILKVGELPAGHDPDRVARRARLTLQDDLTPRLAKTGARGVLIDISALEIVDCFIGRMLAQISSIVGVMDATMVLVGMRPAVAITLVELGMTMTGVRAALNVDKGLTLLRRSLDDSEEPTSTS